jgi:hypothetical protein
VISVVSSKPSSNFTQKNQLLHCRNEVGGEEKSTQVEGRHITELQTLSLWFFGWLIVGFHFGDSQADFSPWAILQTFLQALKITSFPVGTSPNPGGMHKGSSCHCWGYWLCQGGSMKLVPGHCLVRWYDSVWGCWDPWEGMELSCALPGEVDSTHPVGRTFHLQLRRLPS